MKRAVSSGLTLVGLASAIATVAIVVTAVVMTAASGASAAAGKTISVNADFTWNGVRNCGTQRPGSVICVAAQAKVNGLGLVEYARDAVPSGQTTPDGCPEFSTQGTLWVPGGTAKFDGTPVPTCGANDSPDAHYALSLRDGAGVLAGATGAGDVVADNGVDRWHGSITLRGGNDGGTSSGLVVGGVAGGVAVAAAVVALALSRRRRGQPEKTA